MCVALPLHQCSLSIKNVLQLKASSRCTDLQSYSGLILVLLHQRNIFHTMISLCIYKGWIDGGAMLPVVLNVNNGGN